MDVIVNSNVLKSNFMPLTLRLTYRYSVLEFSPPSPQVQVKGRHTGWSLTAE